MLHSQGLRKTRPRRNALRPELFAAPGADDQIGLPRDYLIDRHNAASDFLRWPIERAYATPVIGSIRLASLFLTFPIRALTGEQVIASDG